MSERVLVTGGLGYAGGRIALVLREAGYSLRLSTRCEDCGPAAWLPEAETVSGSLLSDADLDRWCQGVSTVVHLAAMNEQDGQADPLGSIETNIIGTLKLLEAAQRANVAHFLYFSTIHVYGAPLQGIITEACPTQAMTPYSITHRAAEGFVLAAARRSSMVVTIVRPANGFGVPAHPAVNTWMLIVNDLCRQAVTKGRLVMRSSGMQWRNFVPLSDVARAVSHLLRLPSEQVAGQIFNVGLDRSLRVLDLAERIVDRCEAVLGFRPPLVRPDPKPEEVFPEVDYRIDKLLATGFVLQGDIDGEIDATLHMCRDTFAEEKSTIAKNVRVHTPTITLAMPVYNGGRYLREAIDSILSQTFADFEFLIIDNCSTDNSVEIIKSYTDPRIRLVRNEVNMGIAYSRNKGIELARGRYLAWMDCDDASFPERLERQFSYMEEHPEISVSGTWMRTMDRPDHIWRYPTDPELLKCQLLFGSPLASPSVILRCEDFRASDIRYYSPYGTEDYDLWVQFSRHGKKLSNLSDVLINYRVHTGQSSNSFREKQLEYTGAIQCAQYPLLEIEATPEEKRVHYCLGIGQYFNSQGFVVAVDQWLRKLKQANEKVNYYSEQAFTMLLVQYWLATCRQASPALGSWVDQYHGQTPWARIGRK